MSRIRDAPAAAEFVQSRRMRSTHPAERRSRSGTMRKRKPPPADQGVSRDAWGKVHPVLDLHGLTGDEARRRTEQWLLDRQAERVRTVIVVTGRGLHSQGIPVIRNEVEHLLQMLKGTLVVRWESAGFGGSFQVELRRPPDTAPRPAPVPPLLREADLPLRRRAEEALWELGIDPTPALLEAEIRRILQEQAPDDD